MSPSTHYQEDLELKIVHFLTAVREAVIAYHVSRVLSDILSLLGPLVCCIASDLIYSDLTVPLALLCGLLHTIQLVVTIHFDGGCWLIHDTSTTARWRGVAAAALPRRPSFLLLSVLPVQLLLTHRPALALPRGRRLYGHQPQRGKKGRIPFDIGQPLLLVGCQLRAHCPFVEFYQYLRSWKC
jgi:hypothetical protein